MSRAVGEPRVIRQYGDLSAQAGVTLLGVEVGKHYKLTLKSADGRVRKITASISASCPHAWQKVLADMRRFARGIA